jgi:predicted aspartyl protease
MKVYTFTKRYDVVSRVLTLPIKICLINARRYYETQGIIDTGSIGSVISSNLVEKLEGIPYNYQFVNTASSHKIMTPVYKASIILCNQIEITNLTVSEGTLPAGQECLIGMDILSLGDLAITHFENKTCLSFRIPSLQSIELKEIISFN